MTSPQRIGVFGGTFDPVHNAHLAIARAARAAARLDRVLFVVAGRPPHKRHGPDATPEHRFAMTRAALAPEPGMEASRIELDRPGPSYTVDTVRSLEAEYPSAELYLIIGQDSLMDLQGWKDPEEILDTVHLLVVPRPNQHQVPAELSGRYTLLDFEETAVSSTQIRRRLANGQSCANLVPTEVQRYIREHGLYGS